jgi:phosphodiesterase/alkaline phosphatase D-like protein
MGINRAWGGMRLYETMRRLDPAFFAHSGDMIYTDTPLDLRRRHLEEPRDRGEVQGRRDPERVPRELPLQPD